MAGGRMSALGEEVVGGGMKRGREGGRGAKQQTASEYANVTQRKYSRATSLSLSPSFFLSVSYTPSTLPNRVIQLFPTPAS